jgi:hypothetical protein
LTSDTDEYAGKSGKLADPCFVIWQPKGTLLWDTGLGDKLAENKGGVDMDGGHIQLDVTLLDQLKAIELTPADITYLSFSHAHSALAGMSTTGSAASQLTRFASHPILITSQRSTTHEQGLRLIESAAHQQGRHLQDPGRL